MGKWCILAFARFIHDLGRGWGVWFAASFFMILSKNVAQWGVPIILIFWPKISMLGSAEQTRYPKIIDNACGIIFCFSKVS